MLSDGTDLGSVLQLNCEAKLERVH